jgi:selenide,water dikinase
MMTAGAVSAHIQLNKIPLIDGVKSLIKAGAIPAGTYRNYRYLRDKVNWQSDISQEEAMLLCDAQTAGGLLIAVAEEKAGQLQAALTKAGCLAAAGIGHVTTKKGERVIEVLS